MDEEYKQYLKSKEWRERRKQRMAIDDNRCAICGSELRLEVHHKTYDNIYDEDVENDLITLCHNCHELMHNLRDAGSEFADGFKSNFDFLDKYRDTLYENKSYPTQITDIDDLLGGGLYEGLYVLGGGPGIGKTSLALQIMNNIAINNKKCIYFSLEMSRSELINKTMSYLLYVNSKTKYEYRRITDDSYMMPSDRKKFNTALEYYREYAKNVYVFDEVGGLNIRNIAQLIKIFIQRTGEKPYVFIDYLQIIAPNNSYDDDKARVDNSISELKRLSRNLGITIFVISSLNRGSYNKKDNITLTSFKESGGIEYGADYLLVLQRDSDEEDESKDEVDIELKLLKNRYGPMGETWLKFIPKCSTFINSKKKVTVNSHRSENQRSAFSNYTNNGTKSIGQWQAEYVPPKKEDADNTNNSASGANNKPTKNSKQKVTKTYTRVTK